MFADSGLSDEMAEKIVAFVDREAGRDAPLAAADEARIRRLIDEDPKVRALVDELRATNAGLDTLLDDVAAVDVPDGLVSIIRGHGARTVAAPAFGQPRERQDARGDDRTVVTPRMPTFRQRAYGPLAAAASIALLISTGALYHVYTSSTAERARLQTQVASANEEVETQSRALAEARADLSRLSGLAEQASTQRAETADQLMANEETVQRLEVERATLEGRYAALESENERLNQRLDARRADIAESEAARDRIAGDLADARRALSEAETSADQARATLTAEVESLESRLAERQQEIASLADELEAGQERSQTASDILTRLRQDQTDLERRLAAAETDKERLETDRQAAEAAAAEAESRLASLQADIEDAESRLATVAAGLTAAEDGRREAVQQVFGLEAELAASQSWLGQIAQYHRVYASTARRHLVEVGADELDHIQDWMTGMLGRDVIVPDLTEFGVTFAGARLLGINEKPVAQLVYLDADDQPLALCIIPSSGDAKEATLSTNGDLNLVDWRDGDHGYAVVGWSEPELLNALTEAIQPVYDL